MFEVFTLTSKTVWADAENGVFGKDVYHFTNLTLNNCTKRVKIYYK